MPIQRFAPMTKDFPTFDCDAHVTEPPWIWERAKDWLSADELEALKATMWYDAETRQLIVNGIAGTGLGSQKIHGTPGMVNVLSLAGPGFQTRYPARPQRPQPQSGYRHHGRAGRLHRPQGVVPTQRSGCATWMSRVSIRS